MGKLIFHFDPSANLSDIREKRLAFIDNPDNPEPAELDLTTLGLINKEMADGIIGGGADIRRIDFKNAAWLDTLPNEIIDELDSERKEIKKALGKNKNILEALVMQRISEVREKKKSKQASPEKILKRMRNGKAVDVDYERAYDKALIDLANLQIDSTLTEHYGRTPSQIITIPNTALRTSMTQAETITTDLHDILSNHENNGTAILLCRLLRFPFNMLQLSNIINFGVVSPALLTQAKTDRRTAEREYRTNTDSTLNKLTKAEKERDQDKKELEAATELLEVVALMEKLKEEFIKKNTEKLTLDDELDPTDVNSLIGQRNRINTTLGGAPDAKSIPLLQEELRTLSTEINNKKQRQTEVGLELDSTTIGINKIADKIYGKKIGSINITTAKPPNSEAVASQLINPPAGSQLEKALKPSNVQAHINKIQQNLEKKQLVVDQATKLNSVAEKKFKDADSNYHTLEMEKASTGKMSTKDLLVTLRTRHYENNLGTTITDTVARHAKANRLATASVDYEINQIETKSLQKEYAGVAKTAIENHEGWGDTWKGKTFKTAGHILTAGLFNKNEQGETLGGRIARPIGNTLFAIPYNVGMDIKKSLESDEPPLRKWDQPFKKSA